MKAPGRVSRALAAPAILAIRLYQRLLAPLLPNLCRFQPSCSHYALESYRRWGVVRGSYLTARRLFRCNPFSRGGFDPVPE